MPTQRLKHLDRRDHDMLLRWGQAVRALRFARGYSQVELGRLIDPAARSGDKYLCNVEMGQRNPTITYWSRVAKAFGLTLGEFATFAEGGELPEAVAALLKDGWQRQESRYRIARRTKGIV